jgi:hypothetical protein
VTRNVQDLTPNYERQREEDDRDRNSILKTVEHRKDCKNIFYVSGTGKVKVTRMTLRDLKKGFRHTLEHVGSIATFLPRCIVGPRCAPSTTSTPRSGTSVTEPCRGGP